MTLQEAAAQLGISEITLSRNFPRTQQNLQKKGIIVMKWGWGKKAEYDIEYTRLDQIELEKEDEQ